MSQPPLNLRRSVQIVRRYWILVAGMTVIALSAGVAYSVLKPPLFTSQALVVISQNGSNISTEVVIVSSEPVLAGALPDIRPAMSLQTLQNQVRVKSLTSGVLSVNVQGSTAAQAQSAANAVASSYIRYVGTVHSPIGHISAQMLARASPPRGSGALKQDIIDGVTGALAGLVVAVISVLLFSRRDRRLRELADIANSIGVPVLAAIPVAHPADAAGWATLLREYDPGAVEAWRLRQALTQLGADADGAGRAAGNGPSVTVVSLSSDPVAVALGPQLAAFAASVGISTALVIGPQQDTNVTASLRAACAVTTRSSGRSSCLETFAPVARAGVPPGAQFVVVVLVVDAREPVFPETVSTAATVLGVSAGGATAEQMAQVATGAARDGRDVVGLLVADPEPSDQTSGRIPNPQRPSVRGAPARGPGHRVPTGNQTVAD